MRSSVRRCTRAWSTMRSEMGEHQQADNRLSRAVASTPNAASRHALRPYERPCRASDFCNVNNRMDGVDGVMKRAIGALAPSGGCRRRPREDHRARRRLLEGADLPQIGLATCRRASPRSASRQAMLADRDLRPAGVRDGNSPTDGPALSRRKRQIIGYCGGYC